MSNKAIGGLVGAAALLFAIVIALFVFIEKIPEGQVGVVYSPSKGADRVIDAGWHVVKPFEKTQKFSVRIQNVKDSVTIATSDGKSVKINASYEMKIDRERVLDIFKELGSQDIEQIQEGWLYQRLFRASRSVISDYSVLDIYGTKSNEASAKITEKMAEESKELGFMITNVVLGTPELDEETERAIDDRVKASQELEKLQLEKEIAKSEAEKKKIEAEGEKQKKLIEAQAIKESNELISKSITKEVLEMEEIEARKKHGWIEVTGNDGVIVDTTEQKNKDKK